MLKILKLIARFIIYYIILCFLYFKMLNYIYDNAIAYDIKMVFFVYCMIISIAYAFIKKKWLLKALYVIIPLLIPIIMSASIYIFGILTMQDLHINIYDIMKTNPFMFETYICFFTIYMFVFFFIYFLYDQDYSYKNYYDNDDCDDYEFDDD